MTTLRRLPAALFAALALILVAAPGAGAQTTTRTVAVNGSVTRMIANDSAGFGFGLSLERKSASTALQGTSKRLRAIIAAVKAAGTIDPTDLQTGRISVFKRTDPESGAVTFIARQSVKVVVRDLDKAGAVVDAAVGAGATAVTGPRFFTGDPEAAYQAALKSAFELARQKAAALASSAGLTLGPAISIDEQGGVSPIRTAGGGAIEGDTAAPAAPPIKPGRSRVTARVRVVFEMQ